MKKFLLRLVYGYSILLAGIMGTADLYVMAEPTAASWRGIVLLSIPLQVVLAVMAMEWLEKCLQP